MTPPTQPGRPTIVMQLATSVVDNLVHILVGLVFLGGGGWAAVWAIQHPPLNKTILYGGGIAALFGALLMPTIFPQFKQIVVFVVSTGQQLPIVSAFFGRRSEDKGAVVVVPPPAPPSSPEGDKG
jgi:hypothetical protein